MIGSSYVLSLFGADTGAMPLDSSATLALYKSSLSQADREKERLRRDPLVKRDLAQLDRAISKAKTPEDLLKNPEAVRVLLQGLGLGDQAENTGLARQALLSDPKDPKSLAARLPDRRWASVAEQLGFAKNGLTKLQDPAMRKVIADGLIEYKRLTDIGERSQPVADALYIRNMPEGKAPNIYAVLGDKVLRRVATTLAGLPPELAIQSVEAQARTLGPRIDLKQFADPKQREKLIQRYLLTATATNGLMMDM